MSFRFKEILIYASSQYCADALYFSKILIPDAFIAFSCKGKRIGVLSMLEIGRARKNSAFDVLLPLETVREGARAATGKVSVAAIISFLRKEYQIEGFRVHPDFPAWLYAQLLELDVAVEAASGSFLEERLIKTPEELKHIEAANAASFAGISLAGQWIAAAEVAEDGRLMRDEKPLTSERLQRAIAKRCLDYGAVAQNSIVAGGDQACDPHECGQGPLYAQQFIIVDVFPRVQDTGYYGDMTRTFMKGPASDEQKRLYATVEQAQRQAIEGIQAGVIPGELQEQVEAFFKEQGYETTASGNPQGFIHSLGHGLGLELHEHPSLSRGQAMPLEVGHVVTVEPGLYYPGLGGVRIEDVVCVQKTGCTYLSPSGDSSES